MPIDSAADEDDDEDGDDDDDDTMMVEYFASRNNLEKECFKSVTRTKNRDIFSYGIIYFLFM